MPSEFRLRRSLLMTPANRSERLSRALQCAADVFVFDLEDGVPPEQKAQARLNAADALKTLDFNGRERCVRINGLDTPDAALDLAALPLDRIDSIMVPKAEDPGVVRALVAHLDRLCEAADASSSSSVDHTNPGSPRRIRPIELIVMLETPRGIFNALAVADATPRTTALFFGSGDYTSATGSVITADTLQFPRAVVTAAAAAAHIQAVDAAYFIAVKDAEATRADAVIARSFGFSGKVVFHPVQVDVANEIFSPTADEIARATMIVEGYERARSEGHGTSVTNDIFIAVDLVPPAIRLLSLARQINGE